MAEPRAGGRRRLQSWSSSASGGPKLRAEDNQGLEAQLVGVSKKADGFNHMVLDNMMIFDADKITTPAGQKIGGVAEDPEARFCQDGRAGVPARQIIRMHCAGAGMFACPRPHLKLRVLTNSTLFVLASLDGLSDAALVFLVSVGLSLIFGVLRIVNVAHGSLYAFGAYLGGDAQPAGDA